MIMYELIETYISYQRKLICAMRLALLTAVTFSSFGCAHDHSQESLTITKRNAKGIYVAGQCLAQDSRADLDLSFLNRQSLNRTSVSWRIMLLPFLDRVSTFQHYRDTENWDSEHNMQLLADIPDVYVLNNLQEENKYETCFVSNMTPDWSVRMAIPDITSPQSPKENQIMMVEICRSGIPWMEPRDEPRSGLGETGRIRSCHGDLVTILLKDGSVKQVSLSLLEISNSNLHD